MGLDFWVRPEVLIPRPDTEILVECVLDFIQTSRPLVLDLCTGSGCIGIALAHYSAASVTAIDISPQALALAQKNAVLNGVDNIHFRLSDLFTNLPENQRYDLIVSNPPYIPTAEIAALDEDVRLFEPHTALDGGADGLDLYRRIIQESPSRLRSGGALFLELGDRAGVEALMRQAGFVNITVTRDYAGFERVLSGVFFERN